MLCPNCGTEIPEGDKFCGECGAPRPSVAPTAEAYQPEAPPPGPPPVTPEASAPRRSDTGRTIGMIVAIISVLLGIGLCVLGVLLAAFSAEETSLDSTIVGAGALCFVPALLLVIFGALIWSLFVRGRKG